MTSETRTHFREELDRLEGQTLGALDMVIEAVDRVAEAVQHQDIELAQLVIEDDDRIDGRYLEVHQGVLSLLARQAPVASDLRLIAALLDVIKHAERMGDQCVNVCKLLPLAGNEHPTDQRLVTRHEPLHGIAHALFSEPTHLQQSLAQRVELGLKVPNLH